MSKLLVNIDVDDLELGIDFYTRAFGLRLSRRLGSGVAELLGLQAPIYLLAKPSGSEASETSHAQRDYARHWTPVHLDLAVAHIEPAVERALEAGAALEGAIESHAFGRMARLADPFGHGVCLIQFTGRGYDEIASG